MKLSVIVPTFNRERYVGAALRSLLRQRHDVELDIVVVDDGSTDSTVDVVTSYMREAPQIRLFTQANKGVASARNAGLAQIGSDADFVSFLDSDDVSPPGRFKADLAFFQQDGQLEITYSQVCEIDLIDEDTLAPAEGATSQIFRTVQMAAGIYRRKTIDGLRFDEEFRQAEDVDFLFRLFERKPRCVFPDTVGVYYRRHWENLTVDRAQMRRSFLQACRKSTQRRRLDPSLGNPYPAVNIAVPEQRAEHT